MKTDENKPDYIAESAEALEMLGKGYDHAAIIEPPKKVMALSDNGLDEYKIWGWVKISAKFKKHIKKLKGAKLAIWQVVALSIDESGQCSLSIHEIAEESGYSYSETQSSLAELDDMGYLSTTKSSGKKSLFSPNFAARGSNQPNDDPSRKTRGQETPLQPSGGHPSSLAIEKSHPAIKELKELIPSSIENAIYAGLPVTEEMAERASIQNNAPRQFENALGFSKPLAWWSNKEWTAFAEWVCEIYAEDKLAFGNYNIWRHTPYTKGGMSNNRIRGFVAEFYDSWDMFKMANVKPAEENRPEYRRYVAPEQTEELIPNPKAKQR